MSVTPRDRAPRYASSAVPHTPRVPPLASLAMESALTLAVALGLALHAAHAMPGLRAAPGVLDERSPGTSHPDIPG